MFFTHTLIPILIYGTIKWHHIQEKTKGFTHEKSLLWFNARLEQLVDVKDFDVTALPLKLAADSALARVVALVI